MSSKLAGRKAVVTGGASGIGQATAIKLHSEGCHVAVLDIDSASLAKMHRDMNTSNNRLIPVETNFLAADSTTAAVQTALIQLGGLDILVNNVGAGAAQPFEDIDDSMWQATWELNFMSYVRTTRLALPALRKSGHAVIVNNASDLARQPEAIPIDYGATKAAVLALTKSLARSEGPHIRVNAVAPGPIWTPFWTKPGGYAETLAGVHHMEPFAAVQHEMKSRQLPMQRLGNAAEVANVIAFLCTDEASFVTGSVWGVDGGSIRGII